MGISFKIDSRHLGNFSIGVINVGLNVEIQYTIFYNFEKTNNHMLFIRD